MEDTVKIRRLFAKLDRDSSGKLDAADIMDLIADDSIDTSKLDDHHYDPHETLQVRHWMHMLTTQVACLPQSVPFIATGLDEIL
eukprot:SAG31_NODE_16911_length_690_cov_1.453469_1_plen_83_part_01